MVERYRSLMTAPVLRGALYSPSAFFPLIGTVADMAKGPSRLGAAALPLLRPNVELDLGLPFGGPSFLSTVSRLAAPRCPCSECLAAFASTARRLRVSGFGLDAPAQMNPPVIPHARTWLLQVCTHFAAACSPQE